MKTQSDESRVSKMTDRGLPVIDLLASRYGYTNKFQPPSPLDEWNVHVATCDLRVHYYYKKDGCTEVQFWPWIYLQNFENTNGVIKLLMISSRQK